MPIDPERHLRDEELHALLDGEMAEDVARLARRHLAACDSCPPRLADLERVFSALKSVAERPVHRDLTAGVLSRIPPTRSAGRRWIWVLAAQALVATVLALALGQPAAAEWLALASVRLQLPSTWWLELMAWPRAGWESLLMQAQTILEYGPSLVAQAPPLTWPTDGLAAGPALLAALVVLWLAGNVVLLLPRTRRADARGEV